MRILIKIVLEIIYLPVKCILIYLWPYFEAKTFTDFFSSHQNHVQSVYMMQRTTKIVFNDNINFQLLPKTESSECKCRRSKEEDIFAIHVPLTLLLCTKLRQYCGIINLHGGGGQFLWNFIGSYGRNFVFSYTY